MEILPRQYPRTLHHDGYRSTRGKWCSVKRVCFVAHIPCEKPDERRIWFGPVAGMKRPTTGFGKGGMQDSLDGVEWIFLYPSTYSRIQKADQRPRRTQRSERCALFNVQSIAHIFILHMKVRRARYREHLAQDWVPIAPDSCGGYQRGHD